MTEAIPDAPRSRELVRLQRPAHDPFVLDVGIDVAATVTRGAVGATRAVIRVFRPIAGVVARAPALAGPRYAPDTRLKAMATRGSQIRAQRTQDLRDLLSYLVPAMVEVLLEQIDLNQMVLDHVDIEKIIDGIDLNSIVGRLNLTEIAQQVIEGIDLPGIIRESSSSVASATVVDVRMRGIRADERLSGIVDRLSRRRSREAISAHASPVQSSQVLSSDESEDAGGSD